jgi:hypothetical protein
MSCTQLVTGDEKQARGDAVGRERARELNIEIARNEQISIYRPLNTLKTELTRFGGDINIGHALPSIIGENIFFRLKIFLSPNLGQKSVKSRKFSPDHGQNLFHGLYMRLHPLWAKVIFWPKIFLSPT